MHCINPIRRRMSSCTAYHSIWIGVQVESLNNGEYFSCFRILFVWLFYSRPDFIADVSDVIYEITNEIKNKCYA